MSVLDRIAKLVGVRAAVAVDNVSRAFKGEDSGGDPTGGLGPLAPTVLDRDRAEAIEMQESERQREARNYIGLRNDYCKRRVGAAVLDYDGRAGMHSTPAERLAIRASLDQMPDITRSESDARAERNGVAMPHRSVQAAREASREASAQDGDGDDKWWGEQTEDREPQHFSQRRR